VKIRDREGPEEPHVSIIRRTTTWRVGLRALQVLDSEPPPDHLPKALLDLVREQATQLRAAWDSLYPGNPVREKEADDA